MEQSFAQLRVGLIGLGLEAYWSQFSQLEGRLNAYIDMVAVQLQRNGERVIVNLGLVDNSEKALIAGHECRRQDIDFLVIYATTYSLSSIILPVVLKARVPLLILNLQPAAAIDYPKFNAFGDRTAMTGEWLAYCGSCPIPEMTNVLRRLDMPFNQVTGILEGDPEAWEEIECWMSAATVVKILSHSRLGLMGHYYSGMLDVSTDLAQVSGRFGIHIEMVEVDELSAARKEISHSEIASEVDCFREFFLIDADAPADELARAARTSLALKGLIKRHDLNCLAYYGGGKGVEQNEDTLSSMILGCSLLTAHGVPTAGEYEVKNVIAMKILDLLGAGGSFTEYYAMDFVEDVVLMGHDGPGHAAIAQDKIRVRPLKVYHGKVGCGLSVEMAVKYGPVTLLSVVEDKLRGFRLLVAEAESVSGSNLEIGNTNSRYRFPGGARRFVQDWNAEGPAHHCAIGIGHCASTLRKIATLLTLEFKQIC